MTSAIGFHLHSYCRQHFRHFVFKNQLKRNIETTSRIMSITPRTMEPSRENEHENCSPLSSIKPSNLQILHASVTAQEHFATLTQEQTDFIFSEIAKVANKARVPLAVMAAEETGMGCMEDKVIKNSLACELICDRYKNSKTCGLIREDQPHGLRVYANPVGPVCAITPVTNPTSTAISKCLMLAKTRNAGVFLPHPHAAKCTAEAVRICREAGVKAGAP
jgi:acyl-CoA reductase-like NAD-dependent aldehyde dehydrogenase